MKNRLRAALNVLLGRPTVYRTRFEAPHGVQLAYNKYLVFLENNVRGPKV